MSARRGKRNNGRGTNEDDNDAPVGTPGRSERPASTVQRTAAPPAPRPTIPAVSAPRAASANQATGDGGAEGSAQNGDAHDDDISQNSEVECSQNIGNVEGSQNTGDFDTSSIPVSRRSGDNAKYMLAATGVEVHFEFDKIGVGFIITFIWTQSF